MPGGRKSEKIVDLSVVLRRNRNEGPLRRETLARKLPCKRMKNVNLH